MQEERWLNTVLRVYRDCNPGAICSILGFGITAFLILGSRRDYGICCYFKLMRTKPRFLLHRHYPCFTGAWVCEARLSKSLYYVIMRSNERKRWPTYYFLGDTKTSLVNFNTILFLYNYLPVGRGRLTFLAHSYFLCPFSNGNAAIYILWRKFFSEKKSGLLAQRLMNF